MSDDSPPPSPIPALAAPSVFAPPSVPTADPATTQPLVQPPLTYASPVEVPVPTKPLMGGIHKEITYQGTNYVPFCGGRPKADWSGLETPFTGKPKAGHFRTTYVGKQLTEEAARIAPLNPKFAAGDNVYDFSVKVMEHARAYGLDTVLHGPNPGDPTKAVCIVDNFAPFRNTRMTEDIWTKQSALYDAEYDHPNDEDVRRFLIASLEPGLSATIAKRLTRYKDRSGLPITGGALIVWSEIMAATNLRTTDYYAQEIAKLKTIKPTDFPGQDLTLMATKYEDIAEQLTKANQYAPELTKHMVTTFLTACGGNNDELKYHLLPIKFKLTEEIEATSQITDKEEVYKHMARLNLRYEDICRLARDTYLTLKDNDWPPAKHASDSKTVASSFGANAATVPTKDLPFTVTPSIIAAILQQVNATSGSKRDKTNDICTYCKKKGHWANECNEKKNAKDMQASASNNKGRGKATGNERTRTSKHKDHWRSVEPKTGEAQTKTVQETTYHWCAKCKQGKGRWQTSHGTAGHTGKPATTAATPIANHLTWAFNAALPAAAVHAEFAAAAATSETVRTLASFFPTLALFAFTFADCFVYPYLSASTDVVAATFHTYWWLIVTSTVALFTMIQLYLSLSLPLFFWSLALVLSFGLRHYRPDPDPDPRAHWSRKQKRAEQKQFKPNAPKHPSIRSANLHYKYPLHLRSMGHFTKAKAPTVDDRLRESTFVGVMNQVCTLLFRLSPSSPDHAPHASRHTTSRNRCAHSDARPPKQLRVACMETRPTCEHQTSTRKRSRSRPKNKLHYTPAINHGHHLQPRKCFTVKQQKALRDLFNKSCCFTTVPYNAAATFCAGLKRPELDPATYEAYLSTAALKLPSQFSSSMPKESTYKVIWDSGATVSIDNDRENFVGPIHKPTQMLKLKGVSHDLPVEGIGHVLHAIPGSNGMLRMLKLKAFYVPKAQSKLISTTSVVSDEYKGEQILQQEGMMVLTGLKGDPQRSRIDILIDPENNLPTSLAYRYSALPAVPRALASTVNEVNLHNGNLTESEKEALRWHFRLGHLGFNRIRFLMNSGVLSHSETKRKLHKAAASQLKHPPKCAACLFGKQKRLPAPGKVTTIVQDRAGAIKHNDLHPGQKISVDHFICSTKGRLFTSRGKTADEQMYSGGCIFVDHASGKIHVEFQTHLNSHETLKAKEGFENMCRDFGVVPQAYLSDNGSAFSSAEFASKLELYNQKINFAGVGAHHHNGVAERSIQTVMSIARTMLMHAALHWPDVADAQLWPMSVAQAVYLYNHMPDPTNGLSPEDIFARSRWELSRFNDVHVFGCPVYVLDKRIQDGKSIPRWQSRSKRGVYVGSSPKHASTVPLVLNLETGHISPQFHVVFDDWFATVTTNPADLPDFNSAEWAQTFGDSIYQYVMDDEDITLAEADEVANANADYQRTLVQDAQSQVDPPTPLVQPPTPPTATPQVFAPSPMNDEQPSRLFDNVSPPREPRLAPMRELQSPLRESTPLMSPPRESPSTAPTPAPQEPAPVYTTPAKAKPPTAPPVPNPSPAQVLPPRRSTRTHVPTKKFDNSHDPQFPKGRSTYGLIAASPYLVPSRHALSYTAAELPTPYAFAVKPNSDPDILSYREAMEDVHREQWIVSMQKEIRDLEVRGTWVEVPMSEAKTRILPGTWVLRRKRLPDGTISKYKGRYCVRGDLQDTDDIKLETHSPVVSWPSIRMLLVFALTRGWFSCSVDFANAFVQAKLDDPIWIHLPRGFSSTMGPKTCLRLERSLYGIKIAPRVFFLLAKQALLNIDFKVSDNDSCLFIRADCLIGMYVDDLLVVAKDKKTVDEVVNGLREQELELTPEGDLTAFLGIKLERHADETFTLTQQGLIQKILDATDMADCNPNWVPATSTLGSDPDGKPMTDSWSYPSIVGMMLYLSNNTRPDIAFAVSQVARFNHNPTTLHATAVKTIVRYLKRTKEKGTIVKPDGTMDITCHVDADFAGLYHSEPDDVPTSAKSRMGYIVRLGGCPLVWKSKLISRIVLSTTESEYFALQHAMQTVIHVRRILLEITTAIASAGTAPRILFSCRVFEDNSAALLLATSHRITSRTRHYLVSYHWFWQEFKKGNVELLPCETKMQDADYFTKASVRFVFETNRMRIQGW